MFFSASKDTLYSLIGEHNPQSLEKLGYEDSHVKLRERKPRYIRWMIWVAIATSILICAVVSFKLGERRQWALDHTGLTLALRQKPFNSTDLGLRPNTLFPEPLRNKVLMLDVDTRDWDVETGPEDKSPLAWGRLNHYIYAKVHGYDYKFIKAAPMSDRHNTWVKVVELRRLLKESDYQFIVFTDADVVFLNLNLPLENLFSHWNITSEVAVAGALDPPGEPNVDIFGRININTGFIIMQKTAVTENLMTDWLECPSNTKYPECAHWKTDRFHEQSAFSSFLRYDYADNVRELPCDEANSMPLTYGGRWRNKAVCSGKYVSHFWADKNGLGLGTSEAIGKLLSPEIFQSLAQEWKNGIYDDQSNLNTTIAEMMDERW